MLRNKKKTAAIAGIVALLIVGGLSYLAISRRNLPDKPSTASEAVDAFAKCLTDSGAKFYGASWCSHCRNQKKLFGDSKNLPYVECATSDGNGQAQFCADAKIEGYPTWVFADGSRESGELSFEMLSQKTNCQLPR